ncbi:MAG: putative aliphatic sulfonates transport permease protein SsuC [Candidatus Omnitrophica bacterium]|nr:putative aliphatic sulfonates transport permease protein SsuC [Candidatus Omnitrophota bacterium]
MFAVPTLNRRLLVQALTQAVFYGLLLAVWQTLFELKLWPQYLFPSPGQVGSALAYGFADNSLPIGILVSLKRLLIGYGISIVFGVMLGLVIGKVRLLDETVGGFMVGLQTLPSICWLPLAILWFGLSESAILFVVVMGSLLSVTIATDGGVKNIQPIYLRAGRNMGARGGDLFLHVVLPAALPSILSGFKQGWSFAWRSLMAGEILFMSLGLGHLLNTGRELNDMSQVIAVMIVIVAIGVVMEGLVFGTAERKVRRLWGLDRS